MSCRVYFYEDADFSTYIGCLPVGNYPDISTSGLTRNPDNSISSIKISPGTQIQVFTGKNFTETSTKWPATVSGTNTDYSRLSSVSCTARSCGCSSGTVGGSGCNWNDVISSFKITNSDDTTRGYCLSGDPSWHIELPARCDTVCNESATTKNTCNAIRANYCKTGTNITNPHCAKFYDWTKTNGFSMEPYDVAWRDHCTASTANLTSDACVNYYRNGYGKITYEAAFDTAWGNYCTTGGGHTDPLCACVVSEYECAINFDPKCSTTNAITTVNQRTIVCPSVMNCNQYVNIAPGAISIDDYIGQDCITAGLAGTAIPGGGGTGTGGGGGTGGSGDTDGVHVDDGKSGLSLTVIVFIAVIILALVIAAIIAIRSRKQQAYYPEYDMTYDMGYGMSYDTGYDTSYAPEHIPEYVPY